MTESQGCGVLDAPLSRGMTRTVNDSIDRRQMINFALIRRALEIDADTRLREMATEISCAMLLFLRRRAFS
jgi:hypothetical protein